LVFIRFTVLPVDRRPGAWLCLQDGQRFRGDEILIDAGGVTLKSRAAEKDGRIRRASFDDVSAVFLQEAEPRLDPRPVSGARIISLEGEPLDAPAVRLTSSGAIVDLDPGTDPISLPTERLAGVVWAERPAPRDARLRAGDILLDLSSGERIRGRLVSIDERAVTLLEPGRKGKEARVCPRREVECIWFGGRSPQALDDRMMTIPKTLGRPAWRFGHGALGGPLRLGSRAYRVGLGLRARASVGVPVPPGARWLVADAGADADATPGTAISLHILVDGRRAWKADGLTTGEAAVPLAVPVEGAAVVTFELPAPVGADAVDEMLGGFGDVAFIP
jgi:hypothetical protein